MPPQIMAPDSSPPRSRMVSHPLIALALLALAKCALLAAAHAGLGWKPFLGSNAEGHYVPVAQRMLAEGRFNGPDSRPDSKVGPGYPLLLAAAMKVAGGQYAMAIVFLQVIADLATAAAI